MLSVLKGVHTMLSQGPTMLLEGPAKLSEVPTMHSEGPTMLSVLRSSENRTMLSEGFLPCSQRVLPCSQRTLPCSQRTLPCSQRCPYHAHAPTIRPVARDDKAAPSRILAARRGTLLAMLAGPCLGCSCTPDPCRSSFGRGQ